MSMAFVKRKCANCGKDLLNEKSIVVMADMQFTGANPTDLASRVKFVQGIDSRNAYCNVICLKKDLEKYIETAERTSDRTLQ